MNVTLRSMVGGKIREYITYIAAGMRSKVNSEGEFMARGRIEDVTYDESSSESDTQSESDESDSENRI